MTVLTPVYICFVLGLVQSPQDGQASAAQIVEALSQDKGIGRKAALDELIRSENRKWTPADADKLVDGLVICLRSAWLRTNAASELANLAREYPSQVRGRSLRSWTTFPETKPAMLAGRTCVN